MTNLDPSKYTPEHSTNIVALGHKLGGLGVDAVFNRIEIGPVVTGYFFKLAHSVKLSKILKLNEDFALALGSEKVIVQRVLGEVVVFIPNEHRETIDFKTILDWCLNDETVKTMDLPIPIGVDFRGNKSAFDLTDMPHCLITGSTGSGKSVFESSIICNLCYKLRPDELHMFLVDTKMVDLPLFKSLPHVQLVADSLEKFHQMMFYIMGEIRRRLAVLQGATCRNIKDYHRMNGTKTSMPYIVLMIDEYGDLMEIDQTARKAGLYEETPSVKSWVKQCTQIARAAGVHVICCTQRASVKVVDGDIKTNLPCRICLRLPTSVDSRVVLGENGAENLLGKGDMLIQRPESDSINRYHGPFVSMNDIAQLVNQYEFLKDIMVR